METAIYFMEIHTGAVASSDEWLDDLGGEELAKCIAEGTLVQVEKDEGGNWVEAE